MAHFSLPSIRRNGGIALGALALLVAGGAAGAVAVAASQHPVTMAPATPVAIRSLGTGGIVTIRGRVAEVYGSHFILADGTGRALVDAGPDDDRRVQAGQPLTVQGRFDDGFIHAAFLVDANGKVEQVGPLGGPPRHGPHGPGPDARGREDGPGGRRAPGDDRGPPPPAGTTARPPAAAPATAPAVTG